MIATAAIGICRALLICEYRVRHLIPGLKTRPAQEPQSDEPSFNDPDVASYACSHGWLLEQDLCAPADHTDDQQDQRTRRLDREELEGHQGRRPARTGWHSTSAGSSRRSRSEGPRGWQIG